MTIRLLLFGLFGALLACGRADAQQAAGGYCPPLDAPVPIDFSTVMPDPAVRTDLTVAGIRDYYLERGNAMAPRHTETLGLTSTKTVFSVEGRYVARGNGRSFCVYLDNVTATFGLDRLDIYVASEFPEGSCAFREVMAHENQHIAIVADAVERFKPTVQAMLERAVRETKPAIAADPQQAGRRLTRDIRAKVSVVLEAFNAHTDKEHAAIDTAESYDEVMARCDDWRRHYQGSPQERAPS